MLNDWPEYGLAPLPTPAEMATLDLKAQEVGIPGQVLMENAVRASVDLLKTRWPNLKSKVIYIVAGSGKRPWSSSVAFFAQTASKLSRRSKS